MAQAGKVSRPRLHYLLQGDNPVGKWEERPARPGDSWTTDEGVELVVVPKFATEVMIEAAHAAWKKPRMRLNYQPADDRNSVAVIINAAMLAAVEDDDDPR